MTDPAKSDAIARREPFKPGDRVTQDHIGECIVVGKRNDDGEFPVAALDRDDYVNAYGSVDEDATLVARAVYMTPERIEALQRIADDVRLYDDKSVVRAMLAEAKGENHVG